MATTVTVAAAKAAKARAEKEEIDKQIAAMNKVIADADADTARRNAAAASASASASAAAPAKLKTKAEKLAEMARLQAEVAKAEQIEATPSETASLDRRMKDIEVSHTPQNFLYDDALREQYKLDAGIEFDEDSAEQCFTELDEAYTQLAIKFWKLGVAYHQKREEGKKEKDDNAVKIEEAILETEQKSIKQRHRSCGCPGTDCASSGCGCRTHGQACDHNCGCATRHKDNPNFKCGNPIGRPMEEQTVMIAAQKAANSAKAKERAAKKKADGASSQPSLPLPHSQGLLLACMRLSLSR